jgi:hypothetical protein
VDKKVSCCFTPKQKDLFRSLLQGAGQAVTDLGPKIIMPGKIKLKVARPNRHKHVVARQQKECLGGSKAGNLSSCLRRCNNARRLLNDAHYSSRFNCRSDPERRLLLIGGACWYVLDRLDGGLNWCSTLEAVHGRKTLWILGVSGSASQQQIEHGHEGTANAQDQNNVWI